MTVHDGSLPLWAEASEVLEHLPGPTCRKAVPPKRSVLQTFRKMQKGPAENRSLPAKTLLPQLDSNQ